MHLRNYNFRGKNAGKRRFGLIFFKSVALLLTFTTACTPAETPSPTYTATASIPTTATSSLTVTPAPLPTETPTQAPLAGAPSPTPTVTPTPPPARQQDTLPTRTPTATLIPGNTPPPGIACTTPAGNLNLREGPGLAYAVILEIPGRATVQARKTVSAGWLLVDVQQTVGWVYGPLLSCAADLDTLPVAEGITGQPIVAATPTATNTPLPNEPPPTEAPPPAPEIPIGRWRGDYFDNASLLGEPVLVREDEDINFNWILDSPGAGIPHDNFSVRWTGQFNFEERGDYRFFANADDGIKVYVDGWLVIDAWHTVIPVDYEGRLADIEPGLHTVTVEYFESGGHAHVRVWAERSLFSDDKWFGEYYNNRTLQDPATFTRSAGTIDFDWGLDSPDAKLSTNNFSVRWTRTTYLERGGYKFTVFTEDEDYVRLTIDGWQVLEELQEDAGRVEGYFKDLGGGLHTVVLEFQDHGDRAKVQLRWERQ